MNAEASDTTERTALQHRFGASKFLLLCVRVAALLGIATHAVAQQTFLRLTRISGSCVACPGSLGTCAACPECNGVAVFNFEGAGSQDVTGQLCPGTYELAGQGHAWAQPQVSGPPWQYYSRSSAMEIAAEFAIFDTTAHMLDGGVVLGTVVWGQTQNADSDWPYFEDYDKSISHQGPQGLTQSSAYARVDLDVTGVFGDMYSWIFNACASGTSGPYSSVGGAGGFASFLHRFTLAAPTSFSVHYWAAEFADMLDAQRGGSQCFPSLGEPCDSGFLCWLFPVLFAFPIWYDPPLAHGYAFQATDTNFVAIDAFPQGIDDDGLFTVSAPGLSATVFSVDQRVDFVTLTGGPVQTFEITGIGPLIDSANNQAFPIKLTFDVVGGSFTMSPLYTAATATVRNVESNPGSLSCSMPFLGEVLQANVDLSTTGHPVAYLNAYRRACEIELAGGQVLLGSGPNYYRVDNPGVPWGLFRLGPAVGPSAAFAIQLPLDAALVGTHVTLQATHGGSGPFALSNAVDLVLGF